MKNERTETHSCDSGEKETHGDVIYGRDAINALSDKSMITNFVVMREEKPMRNLIDKQKVIDLWEKYHPTIAVDAMQYDAELRQLPSAQPSDEYNRGWRDGREALREEMWERERDRLD